MLAGLGLLAAACGGGDRVQVLAAASLTDVLPSIVERYQVQHPGVQFELSFAGSQALATQIEEGMPAALFISANDAQAARLLDAGLAERPLVMAENRLVLAVRDDAPWRTVEEVAAAGARVATGAPSVPVGALTEVALAALAPSVAERLRDGVATRDASVRAVLSRVELGEAEAAFVYDTDLVAAPGLRAIALPPEVPRNRYVAVLVTNGAQRRDQRAADFLDFLGGAETQSLLRAAGFVAPGAEAAR